MVKRQILLALLIAITLALALAAMVGAQETTAGQPIVIRWSTESEVSTAGFNIYKSESAEGPWVKINERLIPGSPDPLRGGQYVFTDTEVLAGVTYWYELEEVELSGRTTRLERTQATAGSQAADTAPSLPCAGTLLLLAIPGLVLVRRDTPNHIGQALPL